ncbi:flagellar hook-associated protein FlgL [Geobacter argillaceus]|uniref:Flagellar hook-associated protein 3 FlgL n=1 Tax=Geobacter argillaceus TaxID=345631 RepID=A0A562VJJ5_9BACT|nr:flagellar hook-associated protein FlgL [Geobacter argillaceus]TWJ18060.1 flagellar hook-associated protein 3 FlgL [Geobacter argillaceus]
MRVTPNMTADNSVYNLQQNRVKLDSLQAQIASGTNIHNPSDDPIATRQLLDLEGQLKSGEQFSGNINKAKVWLNISDTALVGISTMVKQAKSVAANIGSGSSDPTVLATAVSQLNEIKKQLVSLGNTQLGDQYIFGGFKDSIPPFNPPNAPDNAYHGTTDPINVNIDKNSQVAINVTGDTLLTGAGGGVNILQQIDNLTAAISANNVPAIQAAATQIDTSSNQIANARSDVAGRIVRLDSAEKMIALNKNTVQTLVENIQNVDMIKAATELTQQKTAFEAALSATAKISQISLLDYLK